jgi:hypothetical protein
MLHFKIFARAGVLLSLAALSLSPAAAADNFVVKDGAGTTITKASKDIGSGVQADKNVHVDSTGVEKDVQANPSVVDTVVKGTGTDRGALVTTAGTAQTLIAANTARRGFSLQNQSSGICYINGASGATQDYHSLLIKAGDYYETKDSHVGTGAISIVCAVANASVYSREW